LTTLEPVTEEVNDSTAAAVAFGRQHVAATTTVRRVASDADLARRCMLMLADATALITAALALGIVPGHAQLSTGGWLAVVTLGGLLAAELLGAYTRDRRSLRPLTSDELKSLATWGLLVTALALIVSHAANGRLPSTPDVLLLIVVLTLLDAALRAGSRWTWRRITEPERVVVIGPDSTRTDFDRKTKLYPEVHATVIAAITTGPVVSSSADARSAIVAEAHSYAKAGAERLVLDSRALAPGLVAELAAICRDHDLKLTLLPHPPDLLAPGAWTDRVAEVPVIHLRVVSLSSASRIAKRTLDVVVSAVLLTVLAPVFAIVAIAVRRDSSGPAIFRQLRAGRGGEPFTVLKFRTMVADAEARLSELLDLEALLVPMFKLPDDPRVTRLGHFLRRTSIDELPQLVNVLRGEMSLVGLRPEQMDLVDRYSPEVRAIRLAVKPGITGPMQVLGRGALTFEERLAVEHEYVDDQSFTRDLSILLQTCGAVLGGRGAG
jgi:exopolysaccharide biosynthesis polyprenyl glycosylphosphotransferase